MKNFVQDGEIVTVTAPYAVTPGQGVLVGTIFGVAMNTAANGAEVEISRTGVFDITTLSTDTFTAGALIYWDNGNRRLTSTSAGNRLVGAALLAKGSGPATTTVVLDGAIR